MSEQPYQVPPLEGENYAARFDYDESIAYVTYKGTLNSAATNAVYAWMGASMRGAGESAKGIKGCMFDFRQVTDFDSQNFLTARAKSISMRLEMSDLIQQIPSALVVETIQQQVMVETFVKITQKGNKARLRIVHSMDEAKAFFNEFHTDQLTQSGDTTVAT